jgi:adenylate cyclase
VNRPLQRFLRKRGATDAEIEDAARHGYLTLLVLDRVILPGARKYTQTDVAAQAGTDLATARALWRALGFPDLAEDQRAFTDADLAALRAFVERLEQPWVVSWTLDRALPQARVLSGGLARVADAESDDFARSIHEAHQAGLDDTTVAELLAQRFDFRDISLLVDHTHRLQLRAALWRKLAGSEPGTPGTVDATVGFADLVGYTALAEGLDDAELAELVDHFAAVAHNTVVAGGGRVVKTIGDEVMFITDTPAAAAEIGVELTAASSADTVLPDARAGLATGTVLSREGDYFGAVVNLASRLTELAYPGTVLASQEVAASVEDDPRFRVRRLPRRKVRGIGRLDLYRLDRAEDRAPAPADQG